MVAHQRCSGGPRPKQEAGLDARGFQREASQQLCSSAAFSLLCPALFLALRRPGGQGGVEGTQLCISLEEAAPLTDPWGQKEGGKRASQVPACIWKKQEGSPQLRLHWDRGTYIQVLGSLFFELFAGGVEELVQDGVGPFAVQSQLTSRVSHWEQGRKGRR